MSTYRGEAARRVDLAAATAGLDLSEREERLLDWLAGWDQDTVGAVVSVLVKARSGSMAG